ncbi:ribokinase [Haloechinothrix sp. YIM 98757]|uniref:Ribokinase n=1 Tax=Haloechinothrix aidingensis TaxID=2752311 RepID=A0A838A3A4_9PSEU|nr:ribokinase [Haloechinothrix aidingensis]MBA0124010.1 ribokinase [Haloechinothrix aidingensis]
MCAVDTSGDPSRDAALVVVGSANRDVTVEVRRRPGPGETVFGGDTRTGTGGKGANVAVAAARLGATVAMVGSVGKDVAGDELLASLREAGVGTGLMRRGERPSGAAYITVTPDGENSIIVSPGANAALGAEDVHAAREMLAGADVLCTVLEVPLEAVRAAVCVAVASGVRVVLNASPVVTLDAATMAAADPLIVNTHEARWLLGRQDDAAVDPAGSARELREAGPRSVVVTCGARGAVVADGSGEITWVRAEPVTVVDTTGAGDAFSGALAARLAAGAELVVAAEHAARVAAISVTVRGTQDSYPTSADVP